MVDIMNLYFADLTINVQYSKALGILLVYLTIYIIYNVYHLYNSNKSSYNDRIDMDKLHNDKEVDSTYEPYEYQISTGAPDDKDEDKKTQGVKAYFKKILFVTGSIVIAFCIMYTISCTGNKLDLPKDREMYGLRRQVDDLRDKVDKELTTLKEINYKNEESSKQISNEIKNLDEIRNTFIAYASKDTDYLQNRNTSMLIKKIKVESDTHIEEIKIKHDESASNAYRQLEEAKRNESNIKTGLEGLICEIDKVKDKIKVDYKTLELSQNTVLTLSKEKSILESNIRKEQMKYGLELATLETRKSTTKEFIDVCNQKGEIEHIDDNLNRSLKYVGEVSDKLSDGSNAVINAIENLRSTAEEDFHRNEKSINNIIKITEDVHREGTKDNNDNYGNPSRPHIKYFTD